LGDFLYRADPWAILLVQHNWLIFLLSALVLWTGYQVYRRPSRPALLRLYGCLLLAFAFEYQKHVAHMFLQATDYLFGADSTAGARSLSQVILIDILPVALYAWGSIVLILGLRQSRS